jgi:hypothetical protein
MEFAEYQFRQSRKTVDGASEGDHLESAARQLAQLPGQRRRRRDVTDLIPEEPPYPEELDYLFRWFMEITFGLPSNGFGPALVTWEALIAWQSLMDIGPLEPWEAKTLVDLGMLRAQVASEKAEQDRKQRRG